MSGIFVCNECKDAAWRSCNAKLEAAQRVDREFREATSRFLDDVRAAIHGPLSGFGRSQDQLIADITALRARCREADQRLDALGKAPAKLEGEARAEEVFAIIRAIEQRAMPDLDTRGAASQRILQRIARWHLETIEALRSGERGIGGMPFEGDTMSHDPPEAPPIS